jgi:hypothetical protein
MAVAVVIMKMVLQANRSGAEPTNKISYWQLIALQTGLTVVSPVR